MDNCIVKTIKIVNVDETKVATVKTKSTSVGVVSSCVNVDGDKTFVYTQRAPSATWQIQHNLNKYPSVSIVDSADSVVIGDVEYIDLNNLIVSFSSGFSGMAYLN